MVSWWASPVRETAEDWYFTHHFVDLETMISRSRQFMQSKREDVGMKSDPIRANQIRFNKGQSKSIRNVILNSAHRALVLKAIEAAKKGPSAKMDAFIKAKGLAAAQQYTVAQLVRVGVDEAAILKAGKAKVAELDAADLVSLAGDFKAIENGDANANELFELKEAKPAAAPADLKSKLKATVEASAPEPGPKAGSQLQVRAGTMPFTYYVSDGVKEHLVGLDGDRTSCNCGAAPKGGGCAHTAAAEQFAAGR
jgi:hypothetical protein